MKKLLIVYLMAILANNSFGQSNDVDYSLEGLAKACAYYDEVSSFHEGLSTVKKDGKYGFINKKGELVIPRIPCKEYKYVGPFSEGLACVGWIEDDCSNRSGYIDVNGNMVVDLNTKYEVIGDFHDGLASVRTWEGKCGFINKNGQEIIPCKYLHASDFSEGLAAVDFESSYDKSYNLVYKHSGYIDTNGNVVISSKKYREIYGFHNGLALVKRDYKAGYIDKSGMEVIPCSYSNASDFSEGLALTEIGGQDGYYINIRGQQVLKFSDIISPKEDFHEGLAIVRYDKYNLYAYVNTSFKFVFYYFEDAKSFSEGLALVKKNGKWGFIDKNGKSTFDFK